MLGDQPRTSCQETEKAYLAHCRRLKQKPVIIRLDESGGEMAGQAGAAELFQKHPEVDGLLALVDACAVGALKAAKAVGLDVPGRLKVATRYDGLRAKLSSPPLTALDLHLDEVAALGVELLAKHMAEAGVPAVLWPSKPELVARGSTVAAAK